MNFSIALAHSNASSSRFHCLNSVSPSTFIKSRCSFFCCWWYFVVGWFVPFSKRRQYLNRNAGTKKNGKRLIWMKVFIFRTPLGSLCFCCHHYYNQFCSFPHIPFSQFIHVIAFNSTLSAHRALFAPFVLFLFLVSFFFVASSSI